MARARERGREPFWAQAGIALIVVVGVLFSLSLLVFGLTLYLKTDTRDLLSSMDEEKASLAAEGGVQKIIYDLNHGRAVDRSERIGEVSVKLEASAGLNYLPITAEARVGRSRVLVVCLAEDNLLTPVRDFRCRRGSFRRQVLKP